MTSTTRRCLYWGLFTLWCVISIAGIYYGMESRAPGQEPGLGQAIWMFYLPTWILSLGMFGGIHGAPGWSFLPSIVLAVLVQLVVVVVRLQQTIMFQVKPPVQVLQWVVILHLQRVLMPM